MQAECNSNTHLQDLLSQLANYFSANESGISASEASKCFLRLPPPDSVALIRLFFLLCPSFRSVLSRQGDVSTTSLPTASRSSNNTDTNIQAESQHCRSQLGDQQITHEAESLGPCGLDQSQDPVSIDNNQPTTSQYASPGGGSTLTQIFQGFDNFNTPPLLQQNDICQQQALNELQDPVIGTLVISPPNTTALPPVFDDDTLVETRLTSCNDIDFTPSLRLLMETCKIDRSVFFHKVEESKAAFPNGQGWRAAIAIKQDNADMRDLLSIYHRFECYNIYRHTVEAGYHTGEHWIRDKRRELAQKLFDDFPERFQDTKSANKCLNWVDQGCRFHEWTKIFSEVSGLGILIALPSEIPRSAYTSRCTKEQMSAAAAKFRALGIHELVKDLELSELGSHVAQRLEEMTTGKRLRADEPEQDPRRSWKTPRLMSSSGTPTLVQSDLSATSPGTITICEDTVIWDQTESLCLSMLPDDNFNNYELSSSTYWDFTMDNQLSAFSFPIDELYQHLNNTDSQAATCSGPSK
ncbi:hypothetical protein QX201_002658 [Fusarium graminearum]|uniref:Uncharacterized protein n=1 Tax=Gibberella zeae TaxID=5518 RepID=A0A4E9EQ04_GIBZA|nr:unnamed protein product [Fusarium graminearum]CAF3615409.1 unnamed protein product [Fusarium graminearum]CAG1989506.1 unnamed protein product [Fusarium graminearum]